MEKYIMQTDLEQLQQDFEDYQQLAHVTSAFDKLIGNEKFVVDDNYNLNMHLLMCTLGIIGESAEFAKVWDDHYLEVDTVTGGSEETKNRIVDEAGDVLWYIAELATWNGSSMFDWYTASFECDTPNEYAIGQFADAVKKYVFHHQKHGTAFLKTIPQIMRSIRLTMHFLHVPLSYVMEYNITKLQKRYGEKFAGYKSLQRGIETGT